jgi:hypothetical protein
LVEKQNELLETQKEHVFVNLKRANQELVDNKGAIQTMTNALKHQEIVISRLSYNRAAKSAKLVKYENFHIFYYFRLTSKCCIVHFYNGNHLSKFRKN